MESGELRRDFRDALMLNIVKEGGRIAATIAESRYFEVKIFAKMLCQLLQMMFLQNRNADFVHHAL